MNKPLPVRLIMLLLDRVNYPVITIGAWIFGLLFGFFAITGSIYPPESWLYLSTPLEATGLFLLLCILPAYLMMCLVAMIRTVPLMEKSISAVLPDSEKLLLQQFSQPRYWYVWVGAGLLYATFGNNISWQALDFAIGNDRFLYSLSLVIGQFTLWAIIGLVLCVNFHNSLLLFRLGKLVEINVYNLDSLYVFGRFGLSALLIITGALALTPLQSLDATFRWDRYANPVMICLPAAFIFMLLPVWSVHRRIKLEKQKQLVSINQEIARASRGFDSSALGHLNALLDRRSHVQHCRNWPMDVSIFTRIFLYLLIPPLAWVGAALVELRLDSFLGG